MVGETGKAPLHVALIVFLPFPPHQGCGKTTQSKYTYPSSKTFSNRDIPSSFTVPQLILDSLIMSNRGAAASIVITQPRRLSAISVAARVSQERLDDGSVGYAIRGETKLSKKTKLLFCTTGVVLRRLSDGDGLQDVTHVIVDEVSNASELCTSSLELWLGPRTVPRWRYPPS